MMSFRIGTPHLILSQMTNSRRMGWVRCIAGTTIHADKTLVGKFEFLTLRYIYINTHISRCMTNSTSNMSLNFVLLFIILYCVDVHIL